MDTCNILSDMSDLSTDDPSLSPVLSDASDIVYIRRWMITGEEAKHDLAFYSSALNSLSSDEPAYWASTLYIAEAYFTLRKFSLAEQHLDEAYEISTTKGDTDGRAFVIFAKAMIQFVMENDTKASEMFLKARTLAG